MGIIRKILIVDDKPENLIALEKLLGDFDCEIIKAGSGNEALAKTLEHNFALALIDVQMPDMDGYETVKLMRQVDKTHLLPVIFLSAIYFENEYLVQGIEAGAVDFITKPIQPRILLGKVKVFLELYEQKTKLEVEIEQRKQTEESLRIAERQLTEAKIKAEVADNLKSAFLANMSHEIRTPLNAIVGFSILLADNNLDSEKKQQFISYINSSSETLLNIINDILDIAKIEAGQLQIFDDPTDINNLLKEIFETFKAELQRIGHDEIELILNLPDQVMNSLILTDENRIKQVVSNLIQNAIKFTPTGFIEFGYTYNDSFIEFFVQDSGIGIAEDKLDIIFDRFLKIQNEHIKNPSGIGLGLSIVKKIVEMMGGCVSVQSKLNEGTRFIFTIPMVTADKHKPTVGQEIEIEPKDMDWSMKNILVAEDEYTNYLLLEEILGATQAQIRWAKNGQEAVEECLNNKKIDVILMDIKMPMMSGQEAFTEIRKTNKKIPIIAQTAYAMAGEEEHFLKFGFNGYLNKPINRKELLQTLQKWLK